MRSEFRNEHENLVLIKELSSPVSWLSFYVSLEVLCLAVFVQPHSLCNASVVTDNFLIMSKKVS